MKKLLTTSLLSLTLISTIGCSSVSKREPRQIPEVKVITEEVRAEIYHPPLPQEIRLEDIRWVVITKDNLEEQIADVEKMLDGDFVIFGMVPTDYENFAWNIQEIRRFVRQQKEIIMYYREATDAGKNDEKSEWLEKNTKMQQKQSTSDQAQTIQEKTKPTESPESESVLSKVGNFFTNSQSKDN